METLTPSVARFIKMTGKTISVENKGFLTEQFTILLQTIISDLQTGRELRKASLIHITSEDLKSLHGKVQSFSGGAIRMPGEYFGYDSGRYTSDGSGVDMATVDFEKNVARAGIEAPTFMGGYVLNVVSKSALKSLLRENTVKMARSAFDEFNSIIHHLVRLLNEKVQEKCKGSELTHKQIETVFRSLFAKLKK